MTDLYTAFMVLSAILVLAALCMLARYENAANIGKRLIEAAGSIAAAEAEIEHVRMGRELNDRLRDKATDALMRRGFRARSNVVHLRFKERGHVVHFTPDGAA